VADAEAAGPGFLNLRMTVDGRGALVAEILAAGEDYGLERAAAVEDAADLLVRNAPAGLVAAVGVDAARYGLVRGRAVDDRRTVDNPSSASGTPTPARRLCSATPSTSASTSARTCGRSPIPARAS
jgi:hypothetical protein